jgi:hypothetical protein
LALTILENWTDEETAPVPARVFQRASLGIDEALSSRIKSPRAPRIRSHLIDYVVPIGRRALEVAIKEAVSQKELNPRLSEWEPEWSRITNASQDAAAALASVIPGEVYPYSFSQEIVEVPPRRGMAGIDAILRSQAHRGTYLGAAIKALNDRPVRADRLIVVTDEQSADAVPAYEHGRGYMINVASFQNGVGYGKHWVHLDGFSEGVIKFILEYEREL